MSIILVNIHSKYNLSSALDILNKSYVSIFSLKHLFIHSYNSLGCIYWLACIHHFMPVQLTHVIGFQVPQKTVYSLVKILSLLLYKLLKLMSTTVIVGSFHHMYEERW